MKQIVKFLFLLLATLSYMELSAQSEAWQWFSTAGGDRHDYSRAIAVDSLGNSYIVGNVGSFATLGQFAIGSYDTNTNFIGMLNPQGIWQWVRQNYISGSIHVRSIAMGSDNCFYVVGHFWNSISYDSTTLTSIGGDDIFIAKLNDSGQCIWITQVGGSGNDSARDIVIDDLGNLYLAGSFSGSVAFGDFTLVSNDDESIFAAKMNSAGTWIWASQDSGNASCTGLAIDPTGCVYVSGSFAGTASFGGHSISSTVSLYTDVFVAKLDALGQWQWASRAGGSYSDFSGNIACDIEGNIYVTGGFKEQASFGSTILTCDGGPDDMDVFLAKIDIDGNWIWANSGGSLASERANDVVIDRLGYIYVTGAFSAVASFGNFEIISNGSADFFVAKADSLGNWIWAKNNGGARSEAGSFLAVDRDANILITGSTKDAGNWEEFFVAKLGYNSPLVLFAADVVQGYAPLIVDFNDYSLPGNSSITSRVWDFGDGATSNEQNPTHIYNEPGTFSVSLTITNSQGLSSTVTKQGYITTIERLPEIALETSATINFGSLFVEEFSDYVPVRFTNIGGADVIVSSVHFISAPHHFELMYPNRNLILMPGMTDSVMVRFAPQSIGPISDSLFIANNSVNEPIIRLKLMGNGLNVTPKPPANLAISVNGGDVQLSWDPVTENLHDQTIVPDFYLVFVSSLPSGTFVYHGFTDDTQYSFPMVGIFQARMFYRVIAYKNYGRSTFPLDSLSAGMSEDDVLRMLNWIQILHE